MAMSSDAEAAPPLAKGLRIQIVQPAQALDLAQLRALMEMTGQHTYTLFLCVYKLYFSYETVY